MIINTVFAFYSLSSILISRFLIHIRQEPDSSLSTAEFAADMAHNKEERDEEDGIEDEESGIELQELSPTARSST